MVFPVLLEPLPVVRKDFAAAAAAAAAAEGFAGDAGG